MKVTYRPSAKGGFTATVEGLRKMADGSPEPIFAIRLGDENAAPAIRAYVREISSDLTARPETIARLNDVVEKATIIQASGQCRRPDCDVSSDFEAKPSEKKEPTSGTGSESKPKKKAKKKKARKAKA